MTKIKTLLLSLSLVALSIMVGIFVIEILFGYWIKDDPWRKTEHLYIIRDQSFNWNTQKLYGDAIPTVQYSRNKYGLRDSCSEPSEIKVLTIGGSTTDQRYIQNGKTFQDILEKKLSTDLNRRICLSNAGVDGHSTFGHIESLTKWLPLIDGLKPQVVLLYLGINDAGFRTEPRGFDRFEDRTDYVKPSWKEHSAVIGLYRKIKIGFSLLLPKQKNGSPQPAPMYAEHSSNIPSSDQYVFASMTDGAENLTKINTKLFSIRLSKIIDTIQSKYQAFPVCISQPHLLTSKQGEITRGVANAFFYNGKAYNGLDYQESIMALNVAMREICTARGAYLDIASAPFNSSDFYDPIHLNHDGTFKLAHYIYEELKKIPIQKVLQ